MVVGFYSIGGWCYSGCWVWDLRTLSQFQGCEMFPGFFQDFMDGYIRLSTLAVEHIVAFMTVGSLSRQSCIESYGLAILNSGLLNFCSE